MCCSGLVSPLMHSYHHPSLGLIFAPNTAASQLFLAPRTPSCASVLVGFRTLHAPMYVVIGSAVSHSTTGFTCGSRAHCTRKGQQSCTAGPELSLVFMLVHMCVYESNTVLHRALPLVHASGAPYCCSMAVAVAPVCCPTLLLLLLLSVRSWVTNTVTERGPMLLGL